MSKEDQKTVWLLFQGFFFLLFAMLAAFLLLRRGRLWLCLFLGALFLLLCGNACRRRRARRG